MKSSISRFMHTIGMRSSSNRLIDICFDLGTAFNRDAIVPIAHLINEKGLRTLALALRSVRLCAIQDFSEENMAWTHEVNDEVYRGCIKRFSDMGGLSEDVESQFVDWIKSTIAPGLATVESNDHATKLIEKFIKDIRSVNGVDEEIADELIDTGVALLSICRPDVEGFTEAQSLAAGRLAYAAWTDAKHLSSEVRRSNS